MSPRMLKPPADYIRDPELVLTRFRPSLSLCDWPDVFDFYRQTPHIDPLMEQWSKAHPGAVRSARRNAKDNLSAWRVNGRVDWTHNDRPPRRRWEEYWKRNHLGFLFQRATAAIASDNRSLRRSAADGFLEWYHDCPVPNLPHAAYWDRATHGFDWREIEVGVRGRKLVALFLAAVHWTDVAPEFLPALLLSVCQHLDYLYSYNTRFGFIPGNHQTHQLPALVAGGVLLPEFREAASWQRLGLDLFRQHLDIDHDADRVQNEYCPHYHSGVTGLYLDSYRVLQRNGQRLPRWMLPALNRMADYVLHSMGPDGRQAPLNDSKPIDERAFLRQLACLLDRSDLLVQEGSQSEIPSTSHVFPAAGQAFLRSDWSPEATFVVLDASNRNSGHWHPGKPGFFIQAGGTPLAANHVFNSYDDPRFVSYFHTATAHNTILVDGEGDNVPTAPWEYAYRTRPRIEWARSLNGVDIIRASTDGYRRMKPPVRFQRTLVFIKPDVVVIHDVLRSRGPHRYEWLLHLVPQEPLLDTKAHTLCTRTGGVAELLCMPAPGAEASLHGPRLRKGWTAAPDTARGKSEEGLQRAPYAVWTKRAAGYATFTFLLHVQRRGQPPLSVTPVPAERERVHAFHLHDGQQDRLLVLDDRRKPVRPVHVAGQAFQDPVTVTAPV